MAQTAEQLKRWPLRNLLNAGTVPAPLYMYRPSPNNHPRADPQPPRFLAHTPAAITSPLPHHLSPSYPSHIPLKS